MSQPSVSSPPGVFRTPSSLLTVFSICRDCFTAPTFHVFCVLACGWLMTPGHWAVTACLVVTGISGQRHHSPFHGFFARASWSVDDVGRKLFTFVVEHIVPEGTSIQLVVDDTLAKKRGAQIFGIGTHIDAVNSTRAWRIFSFGHCWVAASIVVWFPWSNRPWALPVVFRLYRQEKTLKPDEQYNKKTELARELIHLVRSWLPEGRRINVLVDEAYFNSTTLTDLPKNLHLIGAMRPDAVLTAGVRGSKHSNGRPRIRGDQLPKPSKTAEDDQLPWLRVVCSIYRSTEEVAYKCLRAQWYRAAGGRLLGIVILKSRCGKVPFRVFGSTDPSLSPKEIIELFACRWPTEVAFRDLKQFLGFAAPQSWTQRSVERTAPFIGLVYSLIVVWFHLHVADTPAAGFPVRPWYKTKRYPSFADILGAAQRAACTSGLFDPATNTNNLHNPYGPPPAASPVTTTKGRTGKSTVV